MAILMGLLLVLAHGAAPAEVAVTVRVVDPESAPLPGIELSVQEVGDCTGRRAAVPPTEVHTDTEGGVVVRLQNYKSYVIRTDDKGGFEAHEMCLPIRSSWDRSRYIHFQLRLDPRNKITLEEPSVGTSATRSPRLVTGAFAGVYVDAANNAYLVETLGARDGITVEGPDGETMTFSTRANNTFTGPAGRAAFTVVNHRVTGLSRTPNATRAKRLTERQ